MPAQASRSPVVVVDAGHGWDPVHGSYTGAYNRRLRLHEDPFNLDIARRVAAALQSRGAEVYLTRDGDHLPGDFDGDGELTNGDRAHLALHLRQFFPHASGERADAYVSIHLNASPKARVRGVTVVYSDSGAAREVVDASLGLSRLIHGHLVQLLPDSSPPFTVSGLYLDKLGVPHAVVEVGFLTNPQDVAWIQDTHNRQTAAERIARAVMEWWAHQMARTGSRTDPDPPGAGFGRATSESRPSYRSPST